MTGAIQTTGHTSPAIASNPNNTPTLQSHALTAVEQGIWTVISYLAEIDSRESVALAQELKCSTTAIHEFDWERFEDVFQTKADFLARIKCSGTSTMAMATAAALTEIYQNAVNQRPFSHRGRSAEEEIHRIGIVVGSAAALGVLNKTRPEFATSISEIVGAPIATEWCHFLSIIEEC